MLIKWGLQHGTSVIAKSTSPQRIKVWLPACLTLSHQLTDTLCRQPHARPLALLAHQHASRQLTAPCWPAVGCCAVKPERV